MAARERARARGRSPDSGFTTRSQSPRIARPRSSSTSARSPGPTGCSRLRSRSAVSTRSEDHRSGPVQGRCADPAVPGRKTALFSTSSPGTRTGPRRDGIRGIRTAITSRSSSSNIQGIKRRCMRSTWLLRLSERRAGRRPESRDLQDGAAREGQREQASRRPGHPAARDRAGTVARPQHWHGRGHGQRLELRRRRRDEHRAIPRDAPRIRPIRRSTPSARTTRR